jgi:hypothetical protein
MWVINEARSEVREAHRPKFGRVLAGGIIQAVTNHRQGTRTATPPSVLALVFLGLDLSTSLQITRGERRKQGVWPSNSVLRTPFHLLAEVSASRQLTLCTGRTEQDFLAGGPVSAGSCFLIAELTLQGNDAD